MPPKRRATSPVRPSPSKKQKHSADVDAREYARITERDGIVQRDFYPPEISNDRCERYNNNQIPRPIDLLQSTVRETAEGRQKLAAGACVVHWFKRDLRTLDNRALSQASKKAKQAGIPLVCMFILSPQDLQAHCTSAARVDMDLRTLEVLRDDLAEKDIPLYCTLIPRRQDIPQHIVQTCQKWSAKHVFCNIEYEVDELRREAKLITMCLEHDIDFTAVHDDLIVPPGELQSGAGKQYSVYSPWFRSWIKHVHEHPDLLSPSEAPSPNPKSARTKFRDLFESSIPTAPEGKLLEPDDQKRLASIWPAGEHEANERLQRFLQEKIREYSTTRNFPAPNSTSLLSVHLSAGTLSARTAIRTARSTNSTTKLDGGNAGISSWISEIAWRDFYKHILAHWPYVCMSKPFKYEYSDIEWQHNDEHFRAWCEGRTGFPIVDAAMRQLRSIAWMHNRCRMIVASFLAKDLLLDWRRGEKYFMENLVDGDFASNNGGWGFSASTGVDPQPYFRIFNPLRQSERFDPKGEYIRKWVPELEDISGAAIHDPYGRGAEKEAEKAGYPRPIVDHQASRKRALEMYKMGLGRETANVGGGVHN